MIRIGLLGCDSTHIESYGKLINQKNSVLGKRACIVSLWDPDIDKAKTKAQLLGIKDVEESIQEAMQNTDAIMILNRFGEERYELLMQAVEVGIPVFADKPLTMDLDEAQKLIKTYSENNVPLFSSSAFRFSREIQQIRKDLKNKVVLSGSVSGPFECNDLGDDPRLKNIFFYGIHLAEIMQETFGPGFESVRVSTSQKHGYFAHVETTNRLILNLNMLKSITDYYSISVFTEDEMISFTLDLESDYYLRTMKAFLDFVEGSYFGIPTSQTLEALELLFAIKKSAKKDRKIYLRHKCE